MAQPVMHFELIAKDTKKLTEFYTKLFGWRAEDYEGQQDHPETDVRMGSAAGGEQVVGVHRDHRGLAAAAMSSCARTISASFPRMTRGVQAVGTRPVS